MVFYVNLNHSKICTDFHRNMLQDYAEASSPHSVNTAWAMLALIYAGQVIL
jgi:hypothetical protein